MTPEGIPNDPAGQQATYTYKYICYCCKSTQCAQLPPHIIPKTPPGSPHNTPPASPHNTPPASPPSYLQCSPPDGSSSSSSETLPGVVPLVQEFKNTRKVKLPKYGNVRADLLKAWQPVYNYKPIILKKYTKTDYLKHVEIYVKAFEGDKKSAKNSKKSSEAGPAYTVPTGRQAMISTLHATVLKEKMKPIHFGETWYLVIDTKVLLDDMFFIEKLVKSDRHCNVFLPYEIFHDLTAMTRKLRPAHMRIPASRVTKFLPRLFQCGKGQSAMELENVLQSPVAFDSVINCCMQLMKKNLYVVLISDDPGRRERANFIDLPCYTLDATKKVTTTEKLTVSFNCSTIWTT